MGDGIVIRPAVAGDVDGWLECAVGLFAEDGGTRDPAMDVGWPRVHGAAGFAAALGDESRLVVVAEAGGVVVGTLNAQVGEASVTRPILVATLRSLYVVAAYRSAGVGGRLVEWFRVWARDRGAVRVAVQAYASNEAALRFYRREGFEPFYVTLEADV